MLITSAGCRNWQNIGIMCVLEQYTFKSLNGVKTGFQMTKDRFKVISWVCHSQWGGVGAE